MAYPDSPSIAIDSKHTLGVVKWFNVNHGYGFITSDDGTDVFVHANACPDGFLYSGECVEFVVEPSDRTGGVQAASVHRAPQTEARAPVDKLIISAPTFVC